MIFSLLLADTPQFYPISTATTRRTPYARNAMFRSANESGDNSGVSTKDTRPSPVLRLYLFRRATMLLKIYANIHSFHSIACSSLVPLLPVVDQSVLYEPKEHCVDSSEPGHHHGKVEADAAFEAKNCNLCCKYYTV